MITQPDGEDPNLSLEQAYARLVKLFEQAAKKESIWKWLFKATILPLSLSLTVFFLGTWIENSRIEQQAVTNYLLQMTDILLSMEGNEGIIKWSKVSERETKVSEREKLEQQKEELELNDKVRVLKTEIEDLISSPKIRQTEPSLMSSLNIVLNNINNGVIPQKKQLQVLQSRIKAFKEKPQAFKEKLDEQKISDLLTTIIEIEKIEDEIEKIEDQIKAKVDSVLLREAKIVVQTQTSNVLYSLQDQSRRQAIIEFLRISNLGFKSRDNSSLGNNKYLNDFKSTFLAGMSLDRITKGINLSGNDLSLIQLEGGVLNEANLKDTILSQSILQNASFRSADLTKAYLIATDLENAILVDAKLNKANLTDANLENARLSRANFKGAILKRADINSANLGGAKNLTYKQIKSACNWERAIFKVDNKTYEKDEQANENFIEQLKKDQSSNPEEDVNCDRWQPKEEE